MRLCRNECFGTASFIQKGGNMLSLQDSVGNLAGVGPKRVEDLKTLGHVVREVVQVSRVITFGGEQVTLDDLLAARKIKNNEIIKQHINENKNQEYQTISLIANKKRELANKLRNEAFNLYTEAEDLEKMR